MAKVLVFANQKGGVGKTTTVINLGAALAEKKQRVLLVDFDPQGNLSLGLGLEPKPGQTVYELLIGASAAKEVILPSAVPGLDVLPSDLNLSGATVELISAEKREFFLKKALAPLRRSYDWILIDCPPSLGLLTINGFAAADGVMIPLQCEFFALQGFFAMLFKTIERVRRSFRPDLKIWGIVFTMYDGRTRLSREIIDRIQKAFPDRKTMFFKSVIPRSVRLAEAPSHGLPITLYAPETRGAEYYRKLAKEVLRKEETA